MNSVRLDNLSLKYQRFTRLGCKDKRIKKFEFVTKTQLFCVHAAVLTIIGFIETDKQSIFIDQIDPITLHYQVQKMAT